VVIGAKEEDSSATGVNGNQADNSADAAGAAYVFVRTGAVWSQQAYLKASNAEGRDEFGSSVAVDGDTVVVGADGEDSNAVVVNGNQADNSSSGSGAAYVFVRSETTWSQQAYLKASYNQAGIGNSIAVSGDTIVAGTPGEDNLSGAAYVFVRNATIWSQQAHIMASNAEAGDRFGGSVAVSGDTIAVGAYNEKSSATGVNGNQADNSASFAGAAYVFVRNGATWSQQAYLKASNTDFVGDMFGRSVAVSGDTVVVGAYGEASNATGVNGNQADNSASSSGAAYVFVRTGAVWSQQAYLKASNTEAGDLFGMAVAVSGGTVVVGAYYEDSNATEVNGNQNNNLAGDSGAAYVFTGLGPSYSLSASALHGSISGTGDYENGATATLAVTAHPGYLFTGWTGDATGSTNPLSILMNADKTIGATFAPDTNDDDDDGWTNYQEIVEYGTDPTKPDTDGDGVKDSKDAFPLDPAETLDTDHDGIGDNADLDDDGDGLSDEDEINIYHTNPKRADSDGDGITDPDELQVYQTNPIVADMDNDGLSDGAEVFTYHTLPKVADTDGDGFLDGYEVLTGHLPLVATDKPALVAEVRTAIEFTFPTAKGKTYRIEGSPDLSTWETVEDGIPGNGGEIQRFYSIKDKPKGFLRVEEGGGP
jgi:uncharacterized repeat protein (TIGR02543 family)